MEGEAKTKSFEFPTEGVPHTETERERKKTAKKITDCIMSVLRFWRICTKKEKQSKPKGNSGNSI